MDLSNVWKKWIYTNRMKTKVFFLFTENLNKQYKTTNAMFEKMISAMQDYSVSGDVRMLLVMQRHLTAYCDKRGNS